MGTRALITFKDKDGEAVAVYQHSDGYPESEYGVIAELQRVVDSDSVWPLPRFEANEFATGFIAVLKDQPGGYRIAPAGAKWGQAYEYEVTCPDAVEFGEAKPVALGLCIGMVRANTAKPSCIGGSSERTYNQ
jgi:hypothetical protein